MGNANSSGSSVPGGPRDRHKSGDSAPPSSPGVKDGQAFTFEKRNSVTASPNNQKLILQHSHEEDDQPYYTKSSTASNNPSQLQVRI